MAKRVRPTRLRAPIPNDGYLGGQILIAMPSLLDPHFVRSVICLCAHSSEGAMGIVLNQPIEALSWRLACAAPGQDIRIRLGGSAAPADGQPMPRGERPVTFEGHGPLPCPVYDRYALRPGMGFAGPALVEERESTCVIGPATRASVDADLNLVLEMP